MSSQSRYIPALDGLRALAVISVIIYHMNASWLPSGLLGVTMFFVLSGYLITGLLIKEWQRSRTIDLPHFWMRRVRRLVPAIIFMLLVTIVLTGIFAPDMLTKLRNDIGAVLLFVTNWWYIFQDVSYFEAMGAPSPVTHFWSLAIEEQFYIIWPPLLLLLFKMRMNKRYIERGILGASLISVILMIVLFDPAGDPSRVYYGTDTRAFSLLIGAWLAFEFPAERVCGHGRRGLNDAQRQFINGISIVALLGMIVMMIVINGYSPVLYYGGILGLSLLTAILILALVDPNMVMARVFSLAPLVWIGQRSYGIYLWHYPLLLLMNPINFTGVTPWYSYVGQVIVIFAVAEFSYRFVETPIRHGAVGRLYHALKDHTTTIKDYLLSHRVYAIATAVLVVCAVITCIVVPPTNTQSNVSATSALDRPEEQETDEAKPDLPGAEMLAATPGDTLAAKAHNTDFLLIGDSVSVALSSNGGYGYFRDEFPFATLDAAIGRHMMAVPDLYNQHVAEGWNGPVVIFEVGTNSVATEEDVRTMIETVPADKQIFLINVRAPLALQDINNSLIAAAVEEYDNVHLIDWYGTSAGHDEYFDGDGTHLTPTYGCEAYIDMIVGALEQLYIDLGIAPEGSDVISTPEGYVDPESGAWVEGQPPDPSTDEADAQTSEGAAGETSTASDEGEVPDDSAEA